MLIVLIILMLLVMLHFVLIHHFSPVYLIYIIPRFSPFLKWSIVSHVLLAYPRSRTLGQNNILKTFAMDFKASHHNIYSPRYFENFSVFVGADWNLLIGCYYESSRSTCHITKSASWSIAWPPRVYKNRKWIKLQIILLPTSGPRKSLSRRLSGMGKDKKTRQKDIGNRRVYISDETGPHPTKRAVHQKTFLLSYRKWKWWVCPFFVQPLL